MRRNVHSAEWQHFRIRMYGEQKIPNRTLIFMVPYICRQNIKNTTLNNETVHAKKIVAPLNRNSIILPRKTRFCYFDMPMRSQVALCQKSASNKGFLDFIWGHFYAKPSISQLLFSEPVTYHLFTEWLAVKNLISSQLYL